MGSIFLHKKGSLDWDTIVTWLFWIMVIVLVFYLIVAIKNKSFDILAPFKWARNFGDLLK